VLLVRELPFIAYNNTQSPHPEPIAERGVVAIVGVIRYCLNNASQQLATFSMIQISNLIFRYSQSRFRLSVEQMQVGIGEKVAVVGPSGSGKTTLLNLISGISLPEQGTVTVEDTLVSAAADSVRRNFRISRIGMVFQQFELVEYLNVADNILFPFYINRTLSGLAPTRSSVTELAQAMGLQDKLRRHPSQLSQGERQRVAICRAMVTKPVLILADEPTGNLDPANKLVILKLLFESASRNGQTLVAVTHDESILNQFDRVIDVKQFWQE
jgi:putative ABC transport system ATP-binding protein